MKLKTKYKYVFFKLDKDASLSGELMGIERPKIWICLDKKTKNILGAVNYASGWNQYRIYFQEYAIASANHLNDIVDFLKQLNEAIKK